MERLSRVVGPVATNVHILADPASREAIAIDTAIPSLGWIVDALAARGWTLKLIVSTHGHWDHIGDNAAVAAQAGAEIAVHPFDRDRLTCRPSDSISRLGAIGSEVAARHGGAAGSPGSPVRPAPRSSPRSWSHSSRSD